MIHRGTYDGTIYYNPANKFCIISVKTAEKDVPQEARSTRRRKDHLIRFVATGYELPRTDAVELELDGEWKKGKYGMQLQVEQWHEIVPQTKSGVEGYLASGLIKGIGPALAKQIVSRFGVETLDILQNRPERLLEIKGITENKLEAIKTSYAESRMLQDLMTLLSPFKITPKTAQKIYQFFGPASVDILKKSPFELCQISGFGFLRVDAIVQKNGGDLRAPMRIKGALFWALEDSKGKNGHLFLTSEALQKEALQLLNAKIPIPSLRLHAQEVSDVLEDMILHGEVVSVKGDIYLPRVFAQEDETARRIAMRVVEPPAPEKIEQILEQVKREIGLALSSKQEAAVYAAYRHKLDRLNWPGRNYYATCWASEKDTAIVQDYLCGERGGDLGILDFQRNVRDEQLEQRHKRITGAWDQDLAQVPELPKDWTRWIDKVAVRENFIFYRYKRGGAKSGYCTFCGKEVPISGHPYHNKKGRCACCRHPIVFKALGRAGYIRTEKDYAYLIQRCKDGFVLREFWAERTYWKDSLPSGKPYWHEFRRSIYDRSGEIRSYYWGVYCQRETRWISGNPCYYSYCGNQTGRVYGKSLPCMEQKELFGTGLVQWIRTHPVTDPEKYLAVWKRMPKMEQIWKADLPRLTKECFEHCDSVRERILYPNETRLIRALGLDGPKFRRLRQINGDTEDLAWLQLEKRTNQRIPDELFRWFKKERISAKDILFIADRMSPIQIRNYLQKQKPYFDGSCRQALTTWQDYLAMAERLHIDTSDEIIYRARKLRQRHDELVIQCEAGSLELQAENMDKKYPHVRSICEELQKKYAYADEDYLVIAPQNTFDIIKEGRMLHHCVGNDGAGERYYDRIERRESFIMFLRRAEEPEDPYYTLEIEPDGTVRQKRTLFDRQHEDIEQATEFLQKWQKVIAARLTGQDLKLAEQSRVLRNEEFIQMKKDRVVIHTGHLAGHLLADVLLADLMENKEVVQQQELPAAA